MLTQSFSMKLKLKTFSLQWVGEGKGGDWTLGGTLRAASEQLSVSSFAFILSGRYLQARRSTK